MLQEYNLKSCDYESEGTKARLPYKMKRYAADGWSIPLKQNWSETWCTLSIHHEKTLNEILNFKVREDDVFLVTFMKSGTTWMQECVWLLLNNLDFKKSKETNVMIRSIFLEFKGMMPDGPSLMETSKFLASPRLLKTHLPANLVPVQIWQKKQKLIYVARNVKDVIVSSYHFIKSINRWHGNGLSEYVEDFLNNDLPYTSYWAHIINYWRMRHESFIFFVTYEEMQCNLSGVLQRLCTFLQKPPLTQEQLKETVDYLSFGCMQKNSNNKITDFFKESLPGVKQDFKFMRRGIVGSYKDELTPELIAKIDKWTNDHLDQYGLKEEDIFGKV